MYRRHFVLLEILIAFALVSIAIFPFLHYPFQDMRREVNLVYEMELEKLAHNELIDLQIQLYKNEINPQLIFGEKKKSQLASFETVKVQPLQRLSKDYLKTVTIEKQNQKVSEDKIKTVLLNLKVCFYALNDRASPLVSADSTIVVQTKEKK